MMPSTLNHRKATLEDLHTIVTMLADDNLGKDRETTGAEGMSDYVNAFKRIDADPHHYLMVVENDQNIVATCHLTLLPSLTFGGQTRLQIEAVRVSAKCRGHKIGEWMLEAAIHYGRTKGAGIIQLTTNKKRSDALRFYEKLGFCATHEGMKLYIG